MIYQGGVSYQGQEYEPYGATFPLDTPTSGLRVTVARSLIDNVFRMAHASGMLNLELGYKQVRLFIHNACIR